MHEEKHDYMHRKHECMHEEKITGKRDHPGEEIGCWEDLELKREKLSGTLHVSYDHAGLKTSEGEEITLILRGMWEVDEELLEWYELPLKDGIKAEITGLYIDKGTFIVDEIILEDGTVITRYRCKEG